MIILIHAKDLMYVSLLFLLWCAAHLWVLVVGRIFLGFGVGFANQAVTLYNTEMAPAKWRGAMNLTFQASLSINHHRPLLIANILVGGPFPSNVFIQQQTGQSAASSPKKLLPAAQYLVV